MRLRFSREQFQNSWHSTSERTSYIANLPLNWVHGKWNRSLISSHISDASHLTPTWCHSMGRLERKTQTIRLIRTQHCSFQTREKETCILPVMNFRLITIETVSVTFYSAFSLHKWGISFQHMVSCIAITELTWTFTHGPSNPPRTYCGAAPQYWHSTAKHSDSRISGFKNRIPLLNTILITSINFRF
jgi:hypothetical protein